MSAFSFVLLSSPSSSALRKRSNCSPRRTTSTTPIPRNWFIKIWRADWGINMRVRISYKNFPWCRANALIVFSIFFGLSLHTIMCWWSEVKSSHQRKQLPEFSKPASWETTAKSKSAWESIHWVRPQGWLCMESETLLDSRFLFFWETGVNSNESFAGTSNFAEYIMKR